MGFSASFLPSVVGAGNICSAVGSRSVGFSCCFPSWFCLPSYCFLPLLPFVFLLLLLLFILLCLLLFLLLSIWCFFCSFNRFPCFLLFPLSLILSPFLLFQSPVLPLRLLMHFPPSFLLFPCRLSLLLFRLLFFFPLPLLSSVLACRLRLSLLSFLCLSILLSPLSFPCWLLCFLWFLLFSLGYSTPASSLCRPFCCFCPLASSCSFCVVYSLFSAYDSSFLG